MCRKIKTLLLSFVSIFFRGVFNFTQAKIISAQACFAPGFTTTVTHPNSPNPQPPMERTLQTFTIAMVSGVIITIGGTPLLVR